MRINNRRKVKRVEVKINPPKIPADTLEEMKKFFAATSIPRIIEARKLKEAK
jgi:hypothetical protein